MVHNGYCSLIIAEYCIVYDVDDSPCFDLAGYIIQSYPQRHRDTGSRAICAALIRHKRIYNAMIMRLLLFFLPPIHPIPRSWAVFFFFSQPKSWERKMIGLQVEGLFAISQLYRAPSN